MQTFVANFQVPTQIALCVVLVVLSGLFIFALEGYNAKLREFGIQSAIEIEMPWTPSRAEALISQLGGEGVRVARKQTYLDFGFLIVYPLTIALLCVLLGAKAGNAVSVAAPIIAVGVLFAGLFDAIENMAMLVMLSGRTGSPWPQLSSLFASIKFTLVLGGIAYVAIALISITARWIGAWLR